MDPNPKIFRSGPTPQPQLILGLNIKGPKTLLGLDTDPTPNLFGLGYGRTYTKNHFRPELGRTQTPLGSNMHPSPNPFRSGHWPHPKAFGVWLRKDLNLNPISFKPTRQPNPYWVWTWKVPNPDPLGSETRKDQKPFGSGHGPSPQPDWV